MSKDNNNPLIVQKIKPIGMVKDTSPSALNPPDSMFKANPQYAYDIKNMRFVPVDGPEMFDLVNERGNLKINILNKTISTYPDQNILDTNFLDIKGIPIGISVIDDELIIFTTENESVIIDDDNDNILFSLESFDLSLDSTSNQVKINYDIFPELNVTESIISDLNITIGINIIDIKTNTINQIIHSVNITELKSFINIDLPTNAFDYLIITEVEIFYKKETAESKKLFSSVVNTTIENKEITTRTSTINNILFPNYGSKTQSINDSSTIEYRFSDTLYPTLTVINGHILKYPSLEIPVYIFEPSDNYTDSFKWFFYDELLKMWILSEDSFPEQLPPVKEILIIYDTIKTKRNLPFYYDGEITLKTSVSDVIYERDGLGSLIPEIFDIERIIYNVEFFIIQLNFETTRTFSSIEITIDGISEILTSPDNKIFIKTDSSFALKENTFHITINSL